MFIIDPWKSSWEYMQINASIRANNMTRYRTFIKIVLLFSFINNNEINQQKNKKKTMTNPRGKSFLYTHFFCFGDSKHYWVRIPRILWRIWIMNKVQLRKPPVKRNSMKTRLFVIQNELFEPLESYAYFPFYSITESSESKKC